MCEDAIKTSGHSADIELREVSQLVLAAVTPSEIGIGSQPDAESW